MQRLGRLEWEKMNQFKFSLCYAGAYAQVLPVELMLGNEYISYQHFVSKPFEKDSRFGLVHIANILVKYNPKTEENSKPNEVMNQAYISMRVSGSFSVLLGGFYSNATDFNASAAFQFIKQYKHIFILLAPRVDLKNNGSYEMFGIIEYRPKIYKEINLYTRFQGMTNLGPYKHNRSYQQFRLGLDIKRFQFGLGINIDEYGAEPEVLTNAGVFIRKVIF